VVLLSALFVWLEGMLSAVWTTFKAGLQNKTTFVLITSAQTLLLLITILLMAVGVRTLEPFLWGRVGAYLVACIASVLWMRHSMGFGLALAEFPAILRGAIPFAISMALALIYERVDVTIVANWIGSTQAGFYAPAATLVGAMFLIPAAMFGVMLPVLSRVHAERSPQLSVLIRQLLLASAGLGVVLYLAVRVSAPYIINLVYGSAYAESTQVLTILAMVLGLRSVTFALAAIIVAVGWQKWRLIPQGIAAAISVIVNILIVSRFGIVGVAWVYVLSETVLMLGYLLLVALWRRRRRSAQLAG
jgi:O-antigen/teichoic acid export membrane protein